MGQPPPHAKPGVDYPIKVHISGIHLRDYYIGYGQSEEVVYADATMDGKKIELTFYPSHYYGYEMALLPGDYQARLLKDSPQKDPYKTKDAWIDQQYELVMRDQTLLWTVVTGIYE